MRITNNMLVNNMMYYMNNNLNRMQKYQAQMATGKKIEVPSDDPIVAAKALKLRTDVSEVDQFKKNSNDAYSWMDVTENTLGKSVDLLQRARELAVQGANGTLTANDRDKIKQEIIQLKGQAVHLANSTYAGRYVFSGYATDIKYMNDDGTYNCSVSSNETAVIKGGLVDLPKTGLPDPTKTIDTSTNCTFNISVDGSNYYSILLTGNTIDGVTAGHTIDDLAKNIQDTIAQTPNPIGTAPTPPPTALTDIKVENNNGRIEFSLKNTSDANGNRLKIYLQNGASPNDILSSINVKTDPVYNSTVSKSEDIQYQVGISDNLSINVPGTELFGTGKKGDVGEFMATFNKFIDSLTYPDNTTSYLYSQPVEATASNQINLQSNNQFNIKVNGMTTPLLVTIPDPDGTYTFDGTTGKTIDDMIIGIQTQISGDPGLNSATPPSANVQVVYKNGVISFSANPGFKIAISEGPPENDALKSLKFYTGTSKTLSSTTSLEGINNSITNIESVRDTVMSIRADIGARMNRADLTLNRLDSDEVNFTKLMSDNEDVDMAETITKFQNEENVYRASLAGGAKIIMPTLIDFLR